jgi:imidazolonepropionase-like amidohydrolase
MTDPIRTALPRTRLHITLVHLGLLLALAGCGAPPAPQIVLADQLPTALPVLPTITSVPTPAPTVIPTPTPMPPPTEVPAPRYDLVLLGATLLDATGAPPLPNAAVAVQGARIVYAGPAEGLTYSADTPVRELRGATIMPGFINAHVHVSGRSDDELRRWTRAGVTTIRDLGGPLDELVPRRDQMRAAGDPSLPRMLVAGPIVSVEGGYPFAVAEQALRVAGVTVQDAEQARAMIESLADGGADVIKLAVSGRTDVRWQELTDEQVAAITGTAHARGLRVSAHVDRSVALRRAVLNGIDNAAHSPRDQIPDDVIALMVERNVSLTPTISVYEALAQQRGTVTVWRKRMQPVMYDNLRRFVAAGGTLALGDDFGGVPGMRAGMPMAELLHWQAAGLSPQQIIEASTRGSALATGLDEELGTVEAGKLADLLVVQGDPLADLNVLAQPLLVLKGGQVAGP